MKPFPIVILGGGVVAGYAAKELVAQLSVWWLKKQTACAALLMNRPEEERVLAPRWILRRPRLDPKALQKTRSLKSLDTTFGRQE